MTLSRVLVTGANGQVGRCLELALAKRDLECFLTDQADLDITDASASARRIAELAPDVLINAAAYTNVDMAESERDLAFAANAVGPGNLAAACRTAGIPLFHISTDYVFDGEQSSPYLASDPVRPLGVYGLSKAEGEDRVRDGWDRHIILRTAWVFSPYGRNFVKTMLKLGAERDELRVVADQQGSPTGAADIAAALAELARFWAQDQSLPWGTYHFTCRGSTSWHGLATEIFKLAEPAWNRRPKVVPIPTSDFPTPARRPANSKLDCSTFDQRFDLPRREWQKSLAETVAALLT